MEQKPISAVTGANGFVGSHLVDLLLEKGHEVRCITRKSSDLKWLRDKDVKIYDCGLTNKEELEKVFQGVNYIFHVAGVVKSKTPEGYFNGNVKATQTVMEAALSAKVTLKKIVQVSSQTAAGPTLNGKAVNEDSPCSPITTYGKSKLAGEEEAKRYMDRLPITICRAPAVYGQRDTEIFIFFQTFSKGLMTSVGLKDTHVSLIHVKDLVKGFYLAAISDKSAGETYFISSEKFYTWKEIGNITSKVMNKKALTVKVPHFMVYTIAAIAQFFAGFSSKPATLNLEKAKDLINTWTCDTSKAIRDLGYHQEIPPEVGIKQTVDWYKEMKWL